MLLLFGTIALLYFARGILVPLAFALILAFVLNPAVDMLKRMGIARVPAVTVVVLTVTVAVGSAGWVIASQLVEVAIGCPVTAAILNVKFRPCKCPTRAPSARPLKA